MAERALLTWSPIETEKATITVKAVITVKSTTSDVISSIGMTKPLDDIQDLLGRTFLVELVSAELDGSKP